MGGARRPPPFITFTITSKVAVYAPAEWAGCFISGKNMYSVATAKVATFLGSIPAASDDALSNRVRKKIQKIPLLRFRHAKKLNF